MKTSKLLEYVAPGTEWALIDEPENELQYVESLTWLSKGNAPTWKQLKDAEPAAKYQQAYDEVSATRYAAYVAPGGSDSIFMQYQRGEATKQQWLDAVQAINDANPYPEDKN